MKQASWKPSGFNKVVLATPHRDRHATVGQISLTVRSPNEVARNVTEEWAHGVGLDFALDKWWDVKMEDYTKDAQTAGSVLVVGIRLSMAEARKLALELLAVTQPEDN